ncbi:MAG: glycosyl transferase, group 1 [Phycisphaerales bacterium]|nr:glycosyl transferase, group 1 [Phycisphaerales bacterium]
MTLRDDPNPPSAPQPKAAVAIICNSHTPYRLHLHQRIAREVPEIKLWSVYTHEVSNAPWAFAVPPEIGPVSFGRGESSDDQAKLKYALREWRKGGRIIRWMKEQNIRLAVVFGYNDAGRLRIIRWCKRQGVPCFLFGDSNIRGDRDTGIKGFAKRQFVSRVVRACTGVMPCGTLGQAYFEKYGATPDRVFFFPYEPDYALAAQIDPAAVAATRQRFGLHADRRRLVYSGRLVPIKRVDLLIDAFIAIASDRPEWDLLIIGDGPERAALQARIPTALTARVTWTGFLDDPKTVTTLYRIGDILVLPSDAEPWAVVINEAAAAGLAIVASDVVGAAAELVRDGVNGRIFPAGDAAALRAALLDITRPDRIDTAKAASAAILADWRRRGDPVQGLRRALESTGVLPPSVR